jgi:hypothetical protein
MNPLSLLHGDLFYESPLCARQGHFAKRFPVTCNDPYYESPIAFVKRITVCLARRISHRQVTSSPIGQGRVVGLKALWRSSNRPPQNWPNYGCAQAPEAQRKSAAMSGGWPNCLQRNAKAAWSSRFGRQIRSNFRRNGRITNCPNQLVALEILRLAPASGRITQTYVGAFFKPGATSVASCWRLAFLAPPIAARDPGLAGNPRGLSRVAGKGP